MRTVVLWSVICLTVLAPSTGAAQDGGAQAPPTSHSGLTVPLDVPPPAELPETAARDETGRLTIRAVRLTRPLDVDGQLDESVYSEVHPVSDFIQIEPEPGAPATQETECWVFYDDSNVYLSVRAYESNLDGMVANEMRRDSLTLVQNEYVNFVIDTFYDRRNAQVFVLNPLGSRMDGQLTNERQYNGDWNPVWNLKTGRFEGGWTAEAAVPFKSLRYRPGTSQVWGLNVSRFNRWKNEISFPIAMPPALGGSASFQVSMAPTLVGIEAPPPARNLEIKPYVISNVTTDLRATPSVRNDFDGDFGVDVKYGITEGLTADFTYNTDFAQVEADEQQVNLTRFSLFFPEKREFFLENRGVFDFGGGGGDVPLAFYSRRIGLSGSRVVPIQGGGRLTGRLGRFTLGMIDIRTDNEPLSGVDPTNFSVLRVKRDILRRSSIGALFTGRSIAQNGVGSNELYGIDGSFAFFDNLEIDTYWAKTQTDGASGDDVSYRAQLNFSGDRYGVQAEQLAIGDNFTPQVGFVRRGDIRKSFGLFRFSPRTDRFSSVRKFFYQASMAYYENGAGRVELRDLSAEVAIEYQNSDRLALTYGGFYEFLPAPFRIASDVTVPTGGYSYDNARLSYKLGQQWRFSGTLAAEYGTFYDGHKTTFSVQQGRLEITHQFSLEPSWSVNRVRIGDGSFTTNLLGSRVTFTATPLMFVSALVQYNSSANSLSSNIRFRWEYEPGSELFVVYNDQRDTLRSGFPDVTNRAFVVKVNRLFRF